MAHCDVQYCATGGYCPLRMPHANHAHFMAINCIDPFVCLCVCELAHLLPVPALLQMLALLLRLELVGAINTFSASHAAELSHAKYLRP